MDTLLTDQEIRRVQDGDTLQKDYFYLPIIMHHGPESSQSSILLFQDGSHTPSQSLYASKVATGVSLEQAVKHDLMHDFGYPADKDFFIESVKSLDTARNKHGQTLTRLIVGVLVTHKFKTTVRPVGYTITWQEYNPGPIAGHYPDEPIPSVNPDQFLAAFYKAVAQERERQGIALDQYTSLALMVDNHYVQDLISGKDDDGKMIVNAISGETMSPNFLHGFMKPIGTDFSHVTLADFNKPRFDLNKPGTVVQIGNVSVAFTLSPIDHKTGHAIKNSPQN